MAVSFPVLSWGSGALGRLFFVLWPCKFLFHFHKVIIYVHVSGLCMLTFLPIYLAFLSLLTVLWYLSGPLWNLTRAGLCLIRFKMQTGQGPGCSRTTSRPHYTDLTLTCTWGPVQPLPVPAFALRLARCTF